MDKQAKLQAIIDRLNFVKPLFEKVNDTTYRYKQDTKTHRGEVTAEIGDSTKPDFKPHIKLSKWEDEVSLEIEAEENETLVPQIVDDKITLKGTQKEYNFYPLKPKTVGFEKWYEPYILHESGGTEFEVILKEKPVTNEVKLKIKSKGLEFLYQPYLTDEERYLMDVEGSIIRFPEVEGSYAVYHKDKKNDYSKAGGKDYKTGKAFHIYRPTITDSAGKTVYGDLKIDEAKGILSIFIPQEFLETALYPIIVDPSIGYTTVGGSSTTIMSNIKGSVFSTTNGFTPTSLSMYLNVNTLNAFKGAIYTHSTLNLLTNGTTVEKSGITATDWQTFTFTVNPTLAGSTDYIIAAWSSSAACGAVANLYYDVGSANQGHNRALNYGAWPDPLTVDSHDTNKYSIYISVVGNPFINALSASDAGFTAGHPFASGAAKEYTVQTGHELTIGITYYWHVRAKDTTTGAPWGSWSATRSFTIATGTTYSKTGAAKARIYSLGKIKTGSAKARIKKVDLVKTASAKAKIVFVYSKTGTVKARILKVWAKTGSAKARIKKLDIVKTGTAKARIKTVGTIKTAAAKGRINSPPTVALNTPTDTGSVTDTTPILDFTGTDIDGNPIEYEVQVDKSNSFPGGTFGTTDETGTSSGGAADTIVGSKYVLSVGALINTISIYAKTNGNVKVAIYTDVGGVPTTRVAVNNNSNAVTANQWNDIAITPTYLNAGTYWICTLDSIGLIRAYKAGGTNQAAYNVSVGFANGCPTTFPTPSYQSNDYVAHADYGPAIDKFSEVDTGFANPDNGGDTHPFNAGENIQYTVQSALDYDIYYWRVRGKDPAGSGLWGAWSSTFSFTVTTANTITKTASAKAHIVGILVKTASAKADIKKFGVAKTGSAKARIKSTGLIKTGSAKARIKKTDISKTGAVKARIKRADLSKTGSAKARIKNFIPKTGATKARIKTSGASKTGAVKADIKKFGVAKTAITKARIKIVNIIKSATSKARIKQANLIKTGTTKARVKNYIVKTGTAKARIKALGTIKTGIAKADIKKFGVAKTGITKARIKQAGIAKTATVKANIKANATTYEKTATTKARIKATLAKTATAKATIKKFGVIKTAVDKARIKIANIVKTGITKARIKILTIKTGIVKARIKTINIVKTGTTKARIKGTGVVKTGIVKARIKIINIVKTSTVKARIKNYIIKTGTVKARIVNYLTKTAITKARIKTGGITKFANVLARIKIANISRTGTAKARIKRIITKTATAKANIVSSNLKTATAKARIKKLGNIKTATAKAYIVDRRRWYVLLLIDWLIKNINTWYVKNDGAFATKNKTTWYTKNDQPWETKRTDL